MAHDDLVQSTPLTGVSVDERVTAFLRVVYGWMCAGLAITAGTAWFVASSPALLNAIIANRAVFWILAIAQLGIVVALSARVDKLSATAASTLFIAYSALTGVTMSFVLLAYTGESVASTFLITAATFGGLALYGTFTRRSLAGMGQFMFMGLIGLLIASFIGFFWQNDGLQFMISLVGVIVFTGLTAWDAQRLKSMALAVEGSNSTQYAVVGALALYLDFINLFLFLLRFLGGRRR
jgi:FtsH-binding integral membrane protein